MTRSADLCHEGNLILSGSIFSGLPFVLTDLTFLPPWKTCHLAVPPAGAKEARWSLRFLHITWLHLAV
jgi:hypothetical protein